MLKTSLERQKPTIPAMNVSISMWLRGACMPMKRVL